MGRYFNIPEGTVNEKTLSLIVIHGAHLLDTMPKFENIPIDKALVCVGDMRMYQYAAYIFDEREYREFTTPAHKEFQQWLLIDKSKAEELAK